jgi:hypothetical protein
MSTKKTIPTNDTEAIEMLIAVLEYLKNSSKNKRNSSSPKKQTSKSLKGKEVKNGYDLQQNDVIALYASEGKEALLEHLNSLDIPSLKKIISTYGFDKSRSSKDWKDKGKFVSLILNRVVSVMNKGEAFKV